MRRDLAYPVHVAGDDWRDELRTHRRHHGWLRDLLVATWVLGWIAVGLVLFFAVGSLTGVNG